MRKSIIFKIDFRESITENIFRILKINILTKTALRRVGPCPAAYSKFEKISYKQKFNKKQTPQEQEKNFSQKEKQY